MTATGAASQPYDIIIIGAGPAGLAAAMYTTREGLSTLVLERGVVGGLAAITATIDNYPGFDRGVGGLELADHLEAHARRFGADIRTGVDVTGLARRDRLVEVRTAHEPLLARSVLIATGSTYKRLEVPGEAEHLGRGVHFCATCDGPLYRDKELVVVGGGNSALQEALFLARFAKHLTMLVRSPELKGSAVLQDAVRRLPNVDIIQNTCVTAFQGGEIGLTAVQARDVVRDVPVSYRADGAFVFIGLRANTQAFAGNVDLDDRGFIRTAVDLATNLPGVYAAGDVRSGATWQIASAVGEGVNAALAIRTYLTGHPAPGATSTVKSS